RRTEPSDARDVLRAGPPPPLLPAACNERSDVETVSQDECADALRPAELMCGKAERVDPEMLEAERQPACSLHRVGMDESAMLAGKLSGVGNWLDHAGLVVRPLQH